MTLANYTNGFEQGVLIRELMKPETTTGKNFYVGNHASLLVGEKSASDGNKGTFLQPFSTIDYAIGQCVAGRGDRIYVRPGHTLSIANATTLVMDVSGVQIIGMGNGELRPIITFATATTASIPISGDNNLIANIVFKCNIASQDQMFDLTAADFTVVGCEFREGTATGVSFINADGTDADADRLRIIGCKFYAPTAGNYDNAIALAKDFTNVELIDNYIYGDFNTAGISVPAGGNAQVNLQIRGGEVTNLLTNVGAIVINGTGSSGSIKDVLLKTDTKSTALDNGSLTTDNVRWASITTDQVPSEPIFVQPDSTENILGADDADNGFASTNVAANRDGSVLERLEYLIQGQADDVANNLIGFDDANNVGASSSVVANVDGTILERLEALMDPLGGYDPVLGFRVTKTSDMSHGSGTDDLFTVTGRCLITHLSGEVTTVIGTTTTMKIQDTTNTVDLCAATTITTDPGGTMYHFDGVKAAVLNSGIAPVVGTTSLANGGYQPVIWGGAESAITISHVLDGAGTGNVAWVLYYKPLVAGATVVAAA